MPVATLIKGKVLVVCERNLNLYAKHSIRKSHTSISIPVISWRCVPFSCRIRLDKDWITCRIEGATSTPSSTPIHRYYQYHSKTKKNICKKLNTCIISLKPIPHTQNKVKVRNRIFHTEIGVQVWWLIFLPPLFLFHRWRGDLAALKDFDFCQPFWRCQRTRRDHLGASTSSHRWRMSVKEMCSLLSPKLWSIYLTACRLTLWHYFFPSSFVSLLISLFLFVIYGSSLLCGYKAGCFPLLENNLGQGSHLLR